MVQVWQLFNRVFLYVSSSNKFNFKDAIFVVSQAWSEVRVKTKAGAWKQILNNEPEIEEKN